MITWLFTFVQLGRLLGYMEYGIQILERMEGGGECSWRDVLK